MKTYTITLFDKKGKKLEETFDVEFEGNIGATFKNYYARYAKMFINPLTDTIQIS